MERLVITVSRVDGGGLYKADCFWIKPDDVEHDTKMFQDAGYEVKISRLVGPHKAFLKEVV